MWSSAPCDPTHHSAAAEPHDPSCSLRLHAFDNEIDDPAIAYLRLIHQLTYRRSNHRNFHVHGYQEEGTITTPFDMTVLNRLDRFHLVMAVLDGLPQTGAPNLRLRQQLADKLLEHKVYIDRYGEDMPEIRDWCWDGPKNAPRAS